MVSCVTIDCMDNIFLESEIWEELIIYNRLILISSLQNLNSIVNSLDKILAAVRYQLYGLEVNKDFILCILLFNIF